MCALRLNSSPLSLFIGYGGVKHRLTIALIALTFTLAVLCAWYVGILKIPGLQASVPANYTFTGVPAVKHEANGTLRLKIVSITPREALLRSPNDTITVKLVIRAELEGTGEARVFNCSLLSITGGSPHTKLELPNISLLKSSSSYCGPLIIKPGKPTIITLRLKIKFSDKTIWGTAMHVYPLKVELRAGKEVNLGISPDGTTHSGDIPPGALKLTINTLDIWVKKTG